MKIAILFAVSAACAKQAPAPTVPVAPQGSAAMPMTAPEPTSDPEPARPAEPAKAPEPAAQGEELSQGPNGDPYMRQLARDAQDPFVAPEHATGRATGCVRLAPDGTIVATKHDPSGDKALDDAVEVALRALQRQRKASPHPVPTTLLRVTEKWICFRYQQVPG